MATRRSASSTPPPPGDDIEENIVDIDVTEEMRGSYLEYAYSVIYSRALPDARDGLKPVQRRILYQMNEMGLRPDRGHVKCARVVGDVMGRLHPHGDSAIYDALVRLAQPWAMRLPLVDGHGNFGSLGGDNPPAAMRYTECRPTQAAMAMVESIDEDTVDFGLNYDGQETEPQVLPAAIPNLLVNGTSGIAVGMATNMAPHNLGEVIAAARHLIKHPDASLEALMKFVPGPDLPTGGQVVGLDGIKEAYATGRGIFRTRATTRVDQISPRKTGIVVTELPYNVGPEKVVARISELVQAKKITGISDVKDLTDRTRGLHLVIEIRSGFNPEGVLAQLYRLTPMEETFGINNVALVDGQPRVLGLREMLTIYVEHRLEVTRRRSEFRRRKRAERLHLVDGILIALLNIDEVIQVIRSSDDSAQAKGRLREIFDLTEVQAQYILDTPLRRLTRFDRLELEREQETLRAEIAELTEILESDDRLRQVVSGEMAEIAKKFGTPRRTVLLEGGAAVTAAVPLEMADDPCGVVLSATGLLARIPATALPDAQRSAGASSSRSSSAAGGANSMLASSVSSTTRGTIGVITTAGRLIKVSVLDIPAAESIVAGTALTEFVALQPGEQALALAALPAEGADDAGAAGGIALGTANGTVKRVQPDYPANRDDFELITLKDDDRVIGAVQLHGEDAELVFITTDAQLLRFPAASVRPQGRPAGGMAGIKLAAGASVVWFSAVGPDAAPRGAEPAPRSAPDGPVVVTVAGRSGALPGTGGASVKVTPFAEYPAKGRATGGVRCQRFLKGEDGLIQAWIGPAPVIGMTEAGTRVDLSGMLGRRDGSGTALTRQLAYIGTASLRPYLVKGRRKRVAGPPVTASGAGKAAVDIQRLAGDVAAGGGGEEHHRPGEVRRLAVAADHRAAGERRRSLRVGGQVRVEPRGDETRADGVHRHPGRCPCFRLRSGQGREAPLGGPVPAAVGERPVRLLGGDVDDPPPAALGHRRAEPLAEQERGGEVDRDCAVPLVFGELAQWRPQVHPGAVDQDVRLAEQRRRLGRGPRHLGPVPKVGADPRRLAAGLAERSGDRLQPGRVPRDEHHPRARQRERGRHPLADPGVPPGHHRDPVSQREQPRDVVTHAAYLSHSRPLFVARGPIQVREES
jgi:DNA gyrase subunit A